METHDGSSELGSDHLFGLDREPSVSKLDEQFDNDHDVRRSGDAMIIQFYKKRHEARDNNAQDDELASNL